MNISYHTFIFVSIGTALLFIKMFLIDKNSRVLIIRLYRTALFSNSDLVSGIF